MSSNASEWFLVIYECSWDECLMSFESASRELLVSFCSTAEFPVTFRERERELLVISLCVLTEFLVSSSEPSLVLSEVIK